MFSFGVNTWGTENGGSPLMTILIAFFVIVLAGAIGRGLWVWIRNNHSPVQNVAARVVSKRMKVTGYGSHVMPGHVSAMHMNAVSSTHTRYFATFETENGERVELSVNDAEYGVLAESDSGRLSFQGTRYLGFERA